MLTLPGFMSLPGGTEWFILLLIILLIFGPKNLPRLGSAMGKFVRNLKAGQQDEDLDDDELEEVAPAEPESKSAAKS
jgi:sec-independent protein translocase protein TatA